MCSYWINILNIVLFYFVVCDGRKKKESERIISGRKAFIEEFPYQISLEMMHQHICGGSILSTTTILTAAHCVDSVKNTYIEPHPYLLVRIGASVIPEDGIDKAVRRVVVHPDYDELSSTDTKDIALVYLMIPLQYSEKVQAIPIVKRTVRSGSMAWVTGYGSRKIESMYKRTAVDMAIGQSSKDDKLEKRQANLMAVELPVLSLQQCRKKLHTLGMEVADDMICAGYDSGHKDACRGDSGGPLVVNGKLAAITAWGIGCGLEGIPGIYTNLAFYADWIEARIRP